jgi:uncharacterized protein (TIGR03067 family)
MGRAVVLVLLAVSSVQAETAAERVRREEQRLEGTWRVIAAEAGGVTVPQREYRELRLTFRGGKFVARRGDEEPQEGTYTIGPSKDPREMDIVRRVGKGKEVRQQGVYSLTGDTLKICASTEDRPRDFSTRDHPDRTLLTLRRVR